LRIKLRIYAKLFHQRGRISCSYAHARRPSRRQAHGRAFRQRAEHVLALLLLACRDRPCRLSNIRADPNLFDLIPQAAAFLSLQKANDLFRNIAKINIYDDQEICYEIFFSSSNVFLSMLPLIRKLLLQPRMYVFCHFLEFPGISVAQA
jgi:hypothetical protein